MADHSTKSSASEAGPRISGPRGGTQNHATERAKDVKGTFLRLVSYLKPYRGTFFIIILMATVGTALALATPHLLGLAVDRLVHKNPAMLLWPVSMMLAAHVLSTAAQIVQGILMVKVSQKAMRLLRADLFNHIQQLPLRFFDTQARGDLMSRLTNDMDAVSQVMTNHASQLFTGVLTIAGILVIIFFLSPFLAAASMVSFPIMLGIVGLVGKNTRRVFRRYQKRLGELNAALEEIYSGQRIVMAFGREEDVLSRFDQANQAVKTTGVKAISLALVVMPMMGILSNFNVAILCGFGGWLAIRGLVSIGTIAAFIFYSRRFAEPLRQLGMHYNQIQGALAGAERIFEILDTVPDETNAPGALKLSDISGDVTLEHVTFSYVPGTPVLKDISIHARHGQRIALVGHTGAGKTTLVNLLSRFYEIDRGRILIDGIDIRSVTHDSLRKQLGIVLQQSFLFSESVLDNIRYGRLSATDEEVYTAARLAHADSFIRRLPRGYNTILSERGQDLSSGQRQLLSIARAILADPAILILDEATSSVDTRTELLIQQALDRLMRRRTSFVIAHRLSTIIGADQVIVIEKGCIVEQGTHETLLAEQGVYHRLYHSQFRNRPKAPFK